MISNVTVTTSGSDWHVTLTFAYAFPHAFSGEIPFSIESPGLNPGSQRRLNEHAGTELIVFDSGGRPQLGTATITYNDNDTLWFDDIQVLAR